MNLRKITLVTLVAGAVSTFAVAASGDDLTSGAKEVVHNNFGECVKVVDNIQSPECQGVQTVAQRQVVSQRMSLAADTFFDFDRAVLKPAGKQELQRISNEVKSRGADVQKITVIGHTDSKGRAEYNQGLSERRAKAVTNYLIENGVPSNLIQTYGRGESEPIADNATVEGRAQNRRVEVTVDGYVQQ